MGSPRDAEGLEATTKNLRVTVPQNDDAAGAIDDGPGNQFLAVSHAAKWAPKIDADGRIEAREQSSE
jgi:hypothetical protein